MTTADISSHLLADWVPSLPPAMGSSFLGWPPFLITTVSVNGQALLALDEVAGRSERQWKSVMSWMIGVAGARHVLATERYRWIAPVSAFFPRAVQVVNTAQWPLSFPLTALSVAKRPRSRSRLFPDYLGLRRSSSARGAYEWVVAEAKGTRNCLTNRRTCPTAWAGQVRNIVVTVNGVSINVPRYLVVATRVNPNAASLQTRRLQVRAWNHAEEQSHLPPDAIIDVVAAHLFGLFAALGLPENARAVALGRMRPAAISKESADTAENRSRRAEAELQQRMRIRDPDQPTLSARTLSFDTQYGPVAVEIAEALIGLARKIQGSNELDLMAALAETDLKLDAWEKGRRQAANERPDLVVLPYGVEIRLPVDAWRARRT